MKVEAKVKIHCNTMRIMLLFNSYFWKKKFRETDENCERRWL